jgi:cysteinyl-tRNA synthetase
MLRIYNTLTRRKEDFVPIKADQVGMYVCGPTVYDFIHIGNARTFTVFDMVYRWLQSSAHGYKVTYLRNVTDVDDKIIQRAAQNGEPIEVLTARMVQEFRADTERLGLAPPTYEPHATRFVTATADAPESARQNMVALIRLLVDKGLAYCAANRDVYYAVHKFHGYGKLSGKSLDDLRAGERVDIDAHKRDPLDFVLWKAAKPGEPSWPSPWGPGRPGWHIECSAMGEAFLGEYFDIHGGGEDLQFPHHENEIAQSEGAHDHQFVKYWMHCAFLNTGNEKMSKSLGNFHTARDVLDSYRGNEEAVRFFLVRGHYRSPLTFTEAALRSARKELDSLYIALRDVPPITVDLDWEHPYPSRFREAMDNDFNTWEAFAVLAEMRNELNKSRSPPLAGVLKALGGTLGFLQRSPDVFLKRADAGTPPSTAIPSEESANQEEERINVLISARNLARRSKNFAEADRIREELDSAGILLEDKPAGVTEWRRK